ncbi:MAG TPA: glycosyltransferase [Guyparkeria sp.]|nr:glycosyltransferase [Guyparkeria sp.]
MRTLVVVRSLKMGGMERVAVNLADAFAQAGHESHLVSLARVKEPLQPEEPGVRCHQLQLKRWTRLTVVGFLLELVARLVLNPLLKRALFLGTGIMGGVVFRLWLKGFEARHGQVDRIIFRGMGTFELVWSFRDARACYVLENIVEERGPRWRQRLFARCLYRDRHLVTVSAGVAESLRGALARWDTSPASLRVIVNPCPIESIRRLMLEPEPDLPEEPYIVTVARLVPAKDQALLLRAYAHSGAGMPLVLVGDGQERGRLEALAAELGIASRVIFVGQRSNPYPWMYHARLFVLSSRFEGMGIVLFEALACGTPVLSVDCPGGIREILKGALAGCVVPHSEEGLACGITEALAEEKPAIQEAWLDDFRPQRVAECFLQPLPDGALADD